MIGNNIQTAGN